MTAVSHFIVTTGRKTAGARLSLVGQWGNLPFVDAAAAEAEARRLGGDTAVVERRSCR